MLNQLPPPPPGKTGLPWTNESDLLPPVQPDDQPWPRISIVTPSFNQGQYIEETIRSILLQNYPNLEYIIIDGGSSDNTYEIIKKYEPWITYWVSEPDHGQSHAINKGFEICNGELVNWICSDDILCQNAIYNFIQNTIVKSNVLYLGDWVLINESSATIRTGTNLIKNIEMLVDISGYWRNGASIAQQSAFYPLQAIRETNGLNSGNYYTMDYELWGDLLLAGCEIQNVHVQIGSFRTHPLQKTAMQFPVTLSLIESSIRLINKSNLKHRTKVSLILKNINYLFWFSYHHLRSRIGIKRRFQVLWKRK